MEKLEIRNFKSVKRLKLNCRKVNVLIGEPNTGKSNILEGLGLLSHTYFRGNLKDFVRFESLEDIFHERDLEREVIISFNDCALRVGFYKGRFNGNIAESGVKKKRVFSYNYSGIGSHSPTSRTSRFKFYRFKVGEEFKERRSDFLDPPSGDNLLTILQVNKQLRSTFRNILGSFGLKPALKPKDGKIEVMEELEEDVFISHPYLTVSETLQRIFFFLAASETNEGSVMVFEEPEAHAFPYYTRFLAERIALDEKDNQYFVSTHNPYFLLSILEKSKEEDVSVLLTHFEGRQTRVKSLTKEQKREILDEGVDLFFNIERFLEE